jgi:Ca-activated chloride channel family protein
MVLVPVVVVDHRGKTVEGLRAQDFTILDDHTPQRIVSLTNEDAPCSVSLILDVSGSMQSTLSVAKNVAHAFFETSNPADEFRLLTVATYPNTISGFTSDVARLESSIEASRPGGLTALIDTVYLGLSHLQESRRPRRALLILSDGMDNHSRYSRREVMRLALESGAQIYTILVSSGPAGMSTETAVFRPGLIKKPWDEAHERQGPSLLEALSEDTGGVVFRIRNDAEALQAATRAAQAIRSEYVIGYQPQQPGSTGKWHQVRVKSDVPHATVYARKRYYSE